MGGCSYLTGCGSHGWVQLFACCGSQGWVQLFDWLWLTWIGAILFPSFLSEQYIIYIFTCGFSALHGPWIMFITVVACQLDVGLGISANMTLSMSAECTRRAGMRHWRMFVGGHFILASAVVFCCYFISPSTLWPRLTPQSKQQRITRHGFFREGICLPSPLLVFVEHNYSLLVSITTLIGEHQCLYIECNTRWFVSVLKEN